MNASSAGNPSRASSMAEARIRSRPSRPWRRCASPHDRTAPGIVTDIGPRKGRRSRPARRKRTGFASAGARPDPFSAVSVREPASQISQNASPPNPHAWGITTARAAFVAIAASTAVPPERRMSRPVAVARWWGATTPPWRPRASDAGTSGRLGVIRESLRPSGRAAAERWSGGDQGAAERESGGGRTSVGRSRRVG